MTNLVFFYGTLMSAFGGDARSRIDANLISIGRGSIGATLFDLGTYPAATPSPEHRVRGEVYRMIDGDAVLSVLDEYEGFHPSEPGSSLYLRAETPVTLHDGSVVQACVYFYNRPLGGVTRIESGDYLAHLKLK